MAKGIIKELIIVLLLIFAIILILGVLLYDYVPTNKILPEEISYSTPKNVKEELNNGDVDEDKVILTYEVDQTDLNNYQKISGYKPGKANPFSSYETKVEDNSNSTSSGSTTNNSNNSVKSNGNNTTTNSSPTTPGSVNPGNYTIDKGLK